MHSGGLMTTPGGSGRDAGAAAAADFEMAVLLGYLLSEQVKPSESHEACVDSPGTAAMHYST